jgi:hypothetical protein
MVTKKKSRPGCIRFSMACKYSCFWVAFWPRTFSKTTTCREATGYGSGPAVVVVARLLFFVFVFCSFLFSYFLWGGGVDDHDHDDAVLCALALLTCE